jgi:hypothetical protein
MSHWPYPAHLQTAYGWLMEHEPWVLDLASDPENMLRQLDARGLEIMGKSDTTFRSSVEVVVEGRPIFTIALAHFPPQVLADLFPVNP